MVDAHTQASINKSVDTVMVIIFSVASRSFYQETQSVNMSSSRYQVTLEYIIKL